MPPHQHRAASTSQLPQQSHLHDDASISSLPATQQQLMRNSRRNISNVAVDFTSSTAGSATTTAGAAASPSSSSSSSPPPTLAHMYADPSANGNGSSASPSSSSVYSPTATLSPPYIHPRAASSYNLLMSPEQRARSLIYATLRDVPQKPLLSVSVTSYERIGDTVLYDVVVQGPSNVKWIVARRFAEFNELNTQLENSVRNIELIPPFPTKEWFFVDHFSKAFLQQRLALLQNYIHRVSQMPKLRASSSFLDFLRPSREDAMDSPNGNGEAREHSYLPPHDDESNELFDRIDDSSGLFEPRSILASLSETSRISRLSASYSSEDSSSLYSHDPTSRRQSHSAAYELPKPSTSTAPAHPSSLLSSASTLTTTTHGSSTPHAASHVHTSTLSPQEEQFWLSPEVSDVSIPSTQVLKQDHVVFQINVENIAKLSAYSRWVILKRFTEFVRLDTTIRALLQQQVEQQQASQQQVTNILSKLPLLPRRESKMLVDHLQPRFIERRRLLLEVYLKRLITIPEICTLDVLLDFLGCN